MKKFYYLMAFGLFGLSNLNAQYQYSDPVQPDISHLGNAINTLQQRFNNNTKRLQNAVNDIQKQINQLDISYEKKQYVLGNLSNRVQSINSKRYDYSSNNVTESIINYLYDSVKKDLKN